MGANGIREFIKWYYPQIRKEGSGRRRARQRRRQRLADAHRAAAARGARHRLLAQRRPAPSLPAGAVVPRPLVTCSTRTRPRTATSSRRCSAGGPRAAHRQAVVGRRGRHHRPRPAHRRRHVFVPVRLRLQQRPRVDHRGLRRRPRHRGRERPGVGDRRQGPAARARHRRGARGLLALRRASVRGGRGRPQGRAPAANRQAFLRSRASAASATWATEIPRRQPW
jgi:hypothetical protein